MADSIELQIIDDVVRTLETSAGVVAATYDQPFDFETADEKLPMAYVWDEGEDYDGAGEASNAFFKELHLIIAVQFLRTTEGLLRQGQAFKAAIEKALMADMTRNSLAFLTLPVQAQTQDLAERRDNLGITAMRWRVQYLCSLTDPTSQVLA